MVKGGGSRVEGCKSRVERRGRTETTLARSEVRTIEAGRSSGRTGVPSRVVLARTDTGVVNLTKSYDTYRVFYRGVAQPDDGIPGLWTIPYFGGVITDTGEFHIWPDELAMEEGKRLAQEEPVPV